MSTNHKPVLKVKRLGIDTYKETVLYLREDSYICEAEGFEAQTRIKISIQRNNRSIVATLNTVKTHLLDLDEVGLSEYAWELLGAQEGDEVSLVHSQPLHSLYALQQKIYGKPFENDEVQEIIQDIVTGRFTNVHISSFITACAGTRGLNKDEMVMLTDAMVKVGERIDWCCKSDTLIVDKHCIGGLPGNRTTPIVVPIIAAFGLMIPKTSSRAITSPAGTADVMETLAPVDMSLEKMKEIVHQEKGCIAWGGSVSLSPADDIIIRVEHLLDIDSYGQMVASVLSKKIAAGSQYVVIDIPIGPTAKVKSIEKANLLKDAIETVASRLGLSVYVIFTDGNQPIGRGMGPALEAFDVLSVLQNKKDAPRDLKEKSLTIAGHILEFSTQVEPGTGYDTAKIILKSGQAWEKFQAICEAQGGMRVPPKAPYQLDYYADCSGEVVSIDNQRIAQVAKLAGAPIAKAAGIVLHTPIGTKVVNKQPLFTIHAESKGELDYALAFVESNGTIIEIK